VSEEERPQSGTFLHPGGLRVSPAPAVITTIVGSCVSVCLRDSLGRAGGMSHFLLPQGAEGKATGLRYANHAVPKLIEQVLKLVRAGGPLEAKIAGGASVLPHMGGARRRFGANNIEAARRLLAKAGIDLVAEAVGGYFARKVIFRVEDGAMWIQDLGVGAGGE